MMFQKLYEPITLQNWHIGLIVVLLIVIVILTAVSLNMTKKIEASDVKKSNFGSAGDVAKQVGTNLGVAVGQGLIEEATGASGGTQNAIVAIASDPSGLNMNTFKQVGNAFVQMGDQIAQSVKRGWDDFEDLF